jgi:hypothetical protein
MSDTSKTGKAQPKTPPPDGEPRQPSRDRDSTAKSKVSEVQDPLIAGDAGKPGGRVETNEASVDEAGQLRRKKRGVDLLH